MVIERIEKVAQQVEFVYRRPRKRNKKKLACQFKKEQISASHTVCSIDQETDFQCVNKKKTLCVFGGNKRAEMGKTFDLSNSLGC